MDFEVLERIVRNRRTVKPAKMNGKTIPESKIQSILQLADWAPTHGRTEPWRFVIFSGESLKNFSQSHANLYRECCPLEKFREDKYQKLIHNGEKASHLIIALMRRTENSKIPEDEEYAAVAAAVENMLLGASAYNLAAIWSTGGMAKQPEMNELLGLASGDKVVSFLYLGYTDEPEKGNTRKIPLTAKIISRK